MIIKIFSYLICLKYYAVGCLSFWGLIRGYFPTEGCFFPQCLLLFGFLSFMFLSYAVGCLSFWGLIRGYFPTEGCFFPQCLLLFGFLSFMFLSYAVGCLSFWGLIRGYFPLIVVVMNLRLTIKGGKLWKN